MLVVPGGMSKDTCDGMTRRELLRVGGSAVFGVNLAGLLSSDRANAAEQGIVGGQGFGQATMCEVFIILSVRKSLV